MFLKWQCIVFVVLCVQSTVNRFDFQHLSIVYYLQFVHRILQFHLSVLSLFVEAKTVSLFEERLLRNRI